MAIGAICKLAYYRLPEQSASLVAFRLLRTYRTDGPRTRPLPESCAEHGARRIPAAGMVL